MPYSVEQLKTLVSSGRGFARPNIFRVELPPLLGGQDAANLNLLCKDVTLPARQVNTTQARIGLITRNIANGYATPDITMTFRMLNDMKVKGYFEYWQSLAVNPNTYEVGFYRDYVQNVKISLLKKTATNPILRRQLFELRSSLPSEVRNRLPILGPLNVNPFSASIHLGRGELDINLLAEDQKVLEVTLEDAYPTLVNAVQLGDDQENNIMEITVNFTFKNYRTDGFDIGNDLSLGNIFSTLLDKVGIG